MAAGDRRTSVFVSYRREGGFVLAKYIFDRLDAAGYDVFMDVQSLGAGEFEQAILAEIAARDYFLVVLTAGSLRGVTREGDWLRKELMQAIECRTTVIPVLAENFTFEDPQVQEVLGKLPPELQTLQTFNALRIPPPEYFDSAMERLKQFLADAPASAPGLGKPARPAEPRGRESAAHAQSTLRELLLPPVDSHTRTRSTTPWSDLQAELVGGGEGAVEAPAKTPGSVTRLPAPTLKKNITSLTWTAVSNADTYILEGSDDAEFTNPGRVVYTGPRTEWFDLFLPRRTSPSSLSTSFTYYRVKAVAKGRAGDSAWSTIIRADP